MGIFFKCQTCKGGGGPWSSELSQPSAVSLCVCEYVWAEYMRVLERVSEWECACVCVCNWEWSSHHTPTLPSSELRGEMLGASGSFYGLLDHGLWVSAEPITLQCALFITNHVIVCRLPNQPHYFVQTGMTTVSWDDIWVCLCLCICVY